jgi:4-hydroxybenzoate polyprenyltransferase
MNPRKTWYNENHRFIVFSQSILFILCIALGCFFIYKNFTAIEQLPFEYWMIIGVILMAGIFYYGLLPRPFFKINLRNTGLLKAFIIGFVWACCANLLSFIIVQIESGQHTAELIFLAWLFLKNWMFCTVNAIIFDIKDYVDDSNMQLKTFAVRFGIRNTMTVLISMPIPAVRTRERRRSQRMETLTSQLGSSLPT